MNEITIKDLYDIIDKRFTGLEGKVEKYHDSFIRFEEGKLTQALQDLEKAKGDILALQKVDGGLDRDKEKRKDWVWGAFEKIIFLILGGLIFFAREILTKLGILNLQ